jgi:16S rRNA (uracil1498-N3)-methyltransferase
MRIPRIFTAQPLIISSSIQLEEGAARHLSSALRMSVGQSIILFDGHGGEYSAALTEVKKSKVWVAVNEFSDKDLESPLKIQLAIGISRGERMDWIVQKATELGATEITPLFTERCEVKLSGERLEKKTRHWQQIAISACEQCQRNIVPIINSAAMIDQYLADPVIGLKLVLHHRTEKRLTEMTNSNNNIALLVGPEGGLSDREIESAIKHNFAALALGPRVLRTETAPLAAISIIQSLWGDMG